MDLYTTTNFYFWIISGLLLDISISHQLHAVFKNYFKNNKVYKLLQTL